MTSSGVNHHVDVREWKGVLRTSFVEIGEINTYSSLFVLLLHNNNVGELVMVLNLAD